ncbi:kelch repeat-containing protein [Henriciella sp.]|uniref:Kelch repeat-containing protein n=1 Tax=Henriciella sp. TaxID=1968823 RepID=UPI00261E250D|nr:kelch repeat-containing protein [Henriciella sp.]
MHAPKLTRRSALLMTLAGTATAGAAPAAWAQARPARRGWHDGPALPFPVQEIYPCLHDGMIHLAGGFIAEDGQITGPTDAHHALDPATGIWHPRAPLPVARHHPQLVSFMGSLFAVGGFESDTTGAWQMQKTVWRYNQATDDWEWTPGLPVPNAESVAGVIGRHLYIAGGRIPTSQRNIVWDDHIDTAACWRFDGERWRKVAAMPTARNSATGGVIDGRLHVVGGRTVGGGNTPVHEVYDPGTDRWETLAPMPQAQAGLAAGIIGEKLYAFGGEWFENGGGVYPDAWVYDARRDRWTSVTDMPKPRHGLGGVTVGRDIYLIGGARERGGSRTSAAVEIYTP